jgi:hypothetical protein
MEVLRDGLTVIEVVERYGVSRQAVHGWLRAMGSAAWTPLPTAPTCLAANAWWNDRENDRCAPQPPDP